MSLSIGKKKSSNAFNQSFSSSPYFTNTGYSSISGNTINLDPSIRNIQDKALQDLASQYGDVGNATSRYLTQSGNLRNQLTGAVSDVTSRFGDLRSRYLGGQGSLVESRLRPVREQFGILSAKTQQDMGRRGVGGSSFGYDSMRNIAQQQALAEGDVRSQAEREALGYETDLLGSEANLVVQANQMQSQMNDRELAALNTQAQQRAALTGESLEVAKARLMQEMGLFGLGSQGTQSGTSSGKESGFNLFGTGEGIKKFFGF